MDLIQAKAFCVYILQSDLDGTFYVGFTSNLQLRIQEHNEGKTRYSSRKRPWVLKSVEWFDNKTDAIRRERFIKAQKSHKWIESLIANGAKE